MATDVIGLIGTGFGLVGFFLSNFPSQAPEGAKVQIKAGLGGDDTDSLGGQVGAVYAYDAENNYLGYTEGGSMGDGGIVEVTVDQTTPGVQADYVTVSMENDAVCVAWVSVKQFDGSPGGAWTGDIGSNCGQTWYASNQQAGDLKDNGGPYKPRCAWFDADHTNGFPSAAFKFRTRAYGEEAQDVVNSGNDRVCGSTIFQTDPGAINGQPQKRSSVKPRREWMKKRIVRSTFDDFSHKAATLCGSETSWGPDFIGSDGMFCDMENKTLSPLCEMENVEGCVELDAEKGHVTKRSSVARREVNAVHRRYTKVEEWN